jgi:phosphatidylethanolamine/phosphatidyl-N-methylethanolamine N-methyltransferase
MAGSIEATRCEQERFDRQARWYNIAEYPMEVLAFFGLRRRLWSLVDGERLLEIGVGTGRNLPYYPRQARVVALDLSPEMLRRAVRLAARQRRKIDFILADAEHLPFRNGVFDTILATFVFCSVPDPVGGLREASRVATPTGRTLLLEHVRADGAFLGRVMDLLNPLTVRLGGESIIRDTSANVRAAGLRIEREESHRMSIVRLLHARPGP